MEKIETLPTERQELINFIIENFSKYYDKDKLPTEAGNYVVLLKKETPFPAEKVDNTPIICNIELDGKGYQLIYTGITSNLKNRIAKVHFGNNAGKSTLRLSLGCLMGYTKIYRDNSRKKKKFKHPDELKLTEWMQKNLLVLYYENKDCGNDEKIMISALNPPLNIEKNHCEKNKKFRSELRYLRSMKTQFEPILE